ncbi:MAG: MBL fold metallo-hydrolase [Promethearchaeota archaeon]
MKFNGLENLQVFNVSKNILLVHQIKASAIFTRCDGLILLPEKGSTTSAIVLDLNLEPQYIKKINEEFGPVSDYICTHTHLDHSAHVHVWEDLGAKIFAPVQEFKNLLNSKEFLESFGFLEFVSLDIGIKFVETMGFKKCQHVIPFNPGEKLIFNELEIKTIHFSGHSPGHIGFYIPSEKLLHISCLGFDQPKPGVDGFGPWYGFKQCSIEQYFKDIDFAESIFMTQSKFLTSSHSYIVYHPDNSPFNYMREKIRKNQIIVDKSIIDLKRSHKKSEINVQKLLELDLFFPKKKMSGILLEIYNLWEYWIIKKHMERSKFLK